MKACKHLCSGDFSITKPASRILLIVILSPFFRYESSGRVFSPFALYKATALSVCQLNLIHVRCVPARQRLTAFLYCLLLLLVTPANNICSSRGASTCLCPSKNGNSFLFRSASLPKFIRCPKPAAFAAAQT